MTDRYKDVPAETLALCLEAWGPAIYELECRMSYYSTVIAEHSISEETVMVYSDKMSMIAWDRDDMLLDYHDCLLELASRRLQPFVDSISGKVTLRLLK